MPLISKHEEKFLDPLSESISKKISSCFGGITIDRFKLKEFAFFRAKRDFLKKHKDWVDNGKIDKETLARLLELNVRLDYRDDFQKLVTDFIELCKEEEKDPEFPARIEKHEEIQRTVFEKEIPEVHRDKDVDKAVAIGGRTLLHLAAEEGNFKEVVRLVEICGAKISIQDASKWTPLMRARLAKETDNHKKVIEYLSKFSLS